MFTIHSYQLRMRGHHRFAIMTASLLLATPATKNGLRLMHFDTESIPIQVDNCCSKSITNDINDMVPNSIKHTKRVVRGFKGEECAATCRGTIKWSWDDDMGVSHMFLIPNSYYVPEATSKLLCPQHWAQEMADHMPLRHGTGCDTNDRCVTLYWSQRLKKRTIPLDPSVNVGILYSTPGYATSNAKCAAIEVAMAQHDVLCCHDLGIVSDDEGDDKTIMPRDERPLLPPKASPWTDAPDEAPNLIEFDLQGPEGGEQEHGEIDVDEEDHIDEPVPAKMLREHHCMAHLPFSRMHAMA